MDLQVELYNRIKVSDKKIETLLDLVKDTAKRNESDEKTTAHTTVVRNYLWCLALIIQYADMLKHNQNNFIPLTKLESNVLVDFNILVTEFSVQNFIEFFITIEDSEDFDHLMASCKVLFTYIRDNGDVYNNALDEFLKSNESEIPDFKKYFMVDYINDAIAMVNKIDETIKSANTDLYNHTDWNLDFDLASKILHEYRDARISSGLIITTTNHSLNILTHNCADNKKLIQLNINWGIHNNVKIGDDLNFITVFNPGVKFFGSKVNGENISANLSRAIMNTEIMFNRMSKFTDINKAFNIPIDIKTLIDEYRRCGIEGESLDNKLYDITREKYTNADMLVGDIKHFVEMFKLLKEEFFAELLKVVLLFIAEFESIKEEKLR